MYCPKCSQQQLAEDLRFCSRCGFPLTGVALLLENDGLISQLAVPETPGQRGKMIKESWIVTLASWAVALLTTLAWDWGGSLESVAKVGSLIFFLLGVMGLLRFVYAFLIVKDGSASAAAPAFPANPGRAALPSPQDIPLTDYPQRKNTREMIPRGSVTENTTRLLDEE
ncbi:MAG TPA: hypothetical protein VFH15_09430 [Pyrinomonadaceae bacterium]|nr:hypothetical protein [Pyrinomonadaceae bacterium]